MWASGTYSSSPFHSPTMTCRPSQRVGDAGALPYEASVKYTREEPGGRAFPRVVYQGAYTCMSPLPFSCEKSLMITPVTVFASSVEPECRQPYKYLHRRRVKSDAPYVFHSNGTTQEQAAMHADGRMVVPVCDWVKLHSPRYIAAHRG